MNKPKRKGLLTEMRVMLSFIELGYSVSSPYGDCERYDFIADVDGRMLRIQCKSAKPIQGVAFDVECRRTFYRQGGDHRMIKYQPGEVDYFATWYEGKTYLIPFEEGKVKTRLRVAPPKIKAQGVHYAEDYEIEKILEELKGGK